MSASLFLVGMSAQSYFHHVIRERAQKGLCNLGQISHNAQMRCNSHLYSKYSFTELYIGEKQEPNTYHYICIIG